LVGLEQLLHGLDRTAYEPTVLLAARSPVLDRLRALGIPVVTVPTFTVDTARSTDLVRRVKGTAAGQRLRRASLLWAWLRAARNVATRTLPLTWRLYRAIRAARPDVVHINDAVFLNRPAIAAAWLARVPVICHVRSLSKIPVSPPRPPFPPTLGGQGGRSGRGGRPFEFWDRVWARTVRRFVFISRWVADDQVARGIPAARGRLIHNGVDMALYTHLPDRQAARAALGLPPGAGCTGVELPHISALGLPVGVDRPLVAVVGRLVAWKGQDLFLHAMRRVVEAVPTALGLIVGETEIYSRDFGRQLQALAAELALGEAVRFIGYRADVPTVLAAIDVLAHTSVAPEPFGRTMVEAMAAGRPVVAPAEGGCLDIVVDGVTGLLYKPRDPEALAEAIIRLLCDPQMAGAMGAAGRARAAEFFTQERYARAVAGLYDEMKCSTPSHPRFTWGLILNLLAGLVVLVGGWLLGRVLLSHNWTQAVTAVGLGAALVALFARPAAGLLLWIWLAPYAKYIYLTLQMGRGIPDLDLTRLAMLVLLFLLIAQGALRRAVGAPGSAPSADRAPLPHLTWPDAAMIVFAIAMALSIPTSWLGPVNGAQTIFDFIVVPFLVYYFARNWLRGQNALLATVGTVALAGFVLGLITAREQITGQTLFSPVQYELVYGSNIRKVLSVFRSPAAMSAALAITVPFLLLGVRLVNSLPPGSSKVPLRGLLGLALLTTLAGVFFAYVRAGWLGVVLSVIVMVWLSPGIRRALLPLLLVMLLAGTILAIAVIRPDTVLARLAAEGPISYRLQAWQIAWEIFRGSPLLGIGYDNFGRTAVAQFGWNPHAVRMVANVPAVHNTYLYTLVSGGLVALLPYLGIFLALALRYRQFWRRREQSRSPRRGKNPAETRDLVATLWATLLSYTVIIGTFDAFNAQFANILFFLIVGTLLGNLERAEFPQGEVAA
jgi:glycosyltransferase involved in cell wall biosynthesis/O-antigen ligase